MPSIHNFFVSEHPRVGPTRPSQLLTGKGRHGKFYKDNLLYGLTEAAQLPCIEGRTDDANRWAARQLSLLLAENNPGDPSSSETVEQEAVWSLHEDTHLQARRDKVEACPLQGESPCVVDKLCLPVSRERWRSTSTPPLESHRGCINQSSSYYVHGMKQLGNDVFHHDRVSSALGISPGDTSTILAPIDKHDQETGYHSSLKLQLAQQIRARSHQPVDALEGPQVNSDLDNTQEREHGNGTELFSSRDLVPILRDPDRVWKAMLRSLGIGMQPTLRWDFESVSMTDRPRHERSYVAHLTVALPPTHPLISNHPVSSLLPKNRFVKEYVRAVSSIGGNRSWSGEPCLTKVEARRATLLRCILENALDWVLETSFPGPTAPMGQGDRPTGQEITRGRTSYLRQQFPRLSGGKLPDVKSSF